MLLGLAQAGLRTLPLQAEQDRCLIGRGRFAIATRAALLQSLPLLLQCLLALAAFLPALLQQRLRGGLLRSARLCITLVVAAMAA
ncbi:hypothetical protein D3C81_817310 [compost metagenome]